MSYDLKNCVKSANGKIYCVDDDGNICEVNMKTIDLKQAPEDVIKTWILLARDKT